MVSKCRFLANSWFKTRFNNIDHVHSSGHTKYIVMHFVRFHTVQKWKWTGKTNHFSPSTQDGHFNLLDSSAVLKVRIYNTNHFFSSRQTKWMVTL